MTFLPPRAAIECLDQALVLGRRSFWRVLRLALLPLLLYYGIIVLMNQHAFGYWIRTPLSIALYGFLGVIEALTTVGAWDVAQGKSIVVAEVWERVGHRLGSVVVSSWIRIVMILLGSVAFVIPGIYFFAVYFAVPGINVIEDLGPWDSLVRSRALALRSLTGILLSLGLFWLIGAVIAIAIPRVLYELHLRGDSILYIVASAVWAALFMPFRGALVATVYLELRKRKEGYDLQHLMDMLPAPLGA
ncbi:MAG TPA: hypothetical protein VL549_11575 [Gemmatimonadales bacterium]|jgi:hypothetical protein|nr:hypothetical protein [Gemmatimonadales bacterium]